MQFNDRQSKGVIINDYLLELQKAGFVFQGYVSFEKTSVIIILRNQTKDISILFDELLLPLIIQSLHLIHRVLRIEDEFNRFETMGSKLTNNPLDISFGRVNQ